MAEDSESIRGSWLWMEEVAVEEHEGGEFGSWAVRRRGRRLGGG